MEAVIEFLNKLARRGVKLSVEAGQLNCYAQPGMLTEDIRAGIIRYKSEIMALLRGRDERLSARTDSGRLVQPKEFPLSAGQKGLYILQKLHPGMSAYNVPLCFKIGGEIQVERLAKAWGCVLEQFPILTARIIEKSGDLYHRLEDGCKTGIQRRAIACGDERQLRSLLRKHAKAPFDLNRGPLTRIELLKQEDGQTFLLLTVHHIIFDGISAMILLRTLVEFYQQMCEDKEVCLAHGIAGYEEFVAWEEAMLASAEGAAHSSYWQGQLSGELPILELQSDLPRLGSASFEGKTLVEAIPEELSRWVNDFSKATSCSPSAIFLGVFQLLLHRYTNQDDIIIGMPVMGRAAQKFASTVGYFVNMVPIRTRLGEGLKVRDFMRGVQGTMLDALYHSSYPFPLMLNKLKIEQTGKNPIFQVTYAYQNFAQQAGITSQPQSVFSIEEMDGVVQEGDFDLVLEIFERERSYGVHLKYNPDLYKQAVIERLFGHYCTLLTGISENPDCPLHEYTILPDHERQRLLVEYNDTRVEYAFWRGPHELIEEQVDLAPDAPAITIGAERISYAQLNLRANQLAYLLRERGVGSEDLVGVCLDRSFELVISCLAILKSGGTYLPLDPKFPEERLRFMLADSEVSLVLAQSSTWRSLPKTSARVLLLDHESESLRKAPTTNLAFRNSPEHLAYLIYTSGSTGRPKGVMIPRRALVNCLLSMSRKPGIAHSSRHLAITTSSFDISILELLLPLVCGAEVVMATTEQASDGRELQRLLWQHEITVMQATPATWRMMLESGWEGKRDLRVFCGGEALTTDLAHKLQQRCRELWNMYGPTETTIWSSIRHLTSEEQISIGRPIDNTQIYVLDKRNKLQPVGVAGELHIAGEGLARGYLKREEMTREKFVGNPFEAGKRMYKTGDVGRWLEDGNLQYLGRMDTQVKIRGFRVETGEIEAQLNQHPKIRESAVIAQGEGGEKRLIGFYRAKEGGGDVVVELSYEELRGYLLKTLPEYMVPAGFVRVEAIPLSVNGKVDRRALGRMEVRIGVGREYVAPRNEIEEKLVGIWGEVLKGGVEKIGVNDNFFELGGHSLLATQLISKIRSRLGVEVPLKAVFERSRVGEMAELIGKVEKSEVPRIGVVDRGQMEGLPLSYAQERLWFINQLEPENVGYNIPGAVFIGGELDVEQLEEAFNVVIGRHENLRTVFPSQEGQARQVILERVEFKLERVELSGGEGAGWRERRAKEICQEEAGRAFDLERGPLMRGKVIELGEREHVLMLNMHHIITDGWSINVLIKELSLTLEAFGQGKRAELERLPIQYVDYSVWQRKWLQGETLDRQLAYWKKQLADIQPLELPMKPKRPEVPGSEAGKISWELSDELSRELKQLSMRQGTTLFMTLLASWQILLARYSGQKDVAVGTPIAGRRFAETHGLIGFFVNT